MIWESRPWKTQLLRSTRRLRRIRRKGRSTEEALFVVEREVFVGCYVVRKLFDTLKVSDSTKELECDVTCYPNVKPVTDFNWHRLDELYDLDDGHRRRVRVRELCKPGHTQFRVHGAWGRHRRRRFLGVVRPESGPRALFCSAGGVDRGVPNCRWRLSGDDHLEKGSRHRQGDEECVVRHLLNSPGGTGAGGDGGVSQPRKTIVAGAAEGLVPYLADHR